MKPAREAAAEIVKDGGFGGTSYDFARDVALIAGAIEAARVEGCALGIEAAAKFVEDDWDEYFSAYGPGECPDPWYGVRGDAIRALDPAAVLAALGGKSGG